MIPRVLLAALAVLLGLAGPARAEPPLPRCVVVIQAAELTSGSGRSLGRLNPGQCLDLVSLGDKALVVQTGPGGEPALGRALSKPRRWQSIWVVLFEPSQGAGAWWTPLKQVQTEGDPKPDAPLSVAVERMGYADPAKLAVLPGPALAHQARLARIAGAGLEPPLALRLMKGIIQKGDSMQQVEMAWARPQRSFMVNLAFDEQHFIYLGRTAKPIILRFKDGRLVPPLPPKHAQ